MRSICLVAPALALAACVTTQEMPLAPNVVRLDTHASGDMFGEDAPGQTMRRAAEVTLQNRFSYFQLQQAQMCLRVLKWPGYTRRRPPHSRRRFTIKRPMSL
jgi:hypothetical protein